jgi:hypothetical protein
MRVLLIEDDSAIAQSIDPVPALFERDAEERPSEDGQPPRKGEKIEYSILWDGRDAKIVSGAAIRPLHHGDYTYPIRR